MKVASVNTVRRRLDELRPYRNNPPSLEAIKMTEQLRLAGRW